MVTFGRGRTHTTRIPTCVQGFSAANAHTLSTESQPQRWENTFFRDLAARLDLPPYLPSCITHDRKESAQRTPLRRGTDPRCRPVTTTKLPSPLSHHLAPMAAPSSCSATPSAHGSGRPDHLHHSPAPTVADERRSAVATPSCNAPLRHTDDPRPQIAPPRHTAS